MLKKLNSALTKHENTEGQGSNYRISQTVYDSEEKGATQNRVEETEERNSPF